MTESDFVVSWRGRLNSQMSDPQSQVGFCENLGTCSYVQDRVGDDLSPSEANEYIMNTCIEFPGACALNYRGRD